MNVNSTIVHDPGQLASEELLEEYEKLSKEYISLKETSERDKQRIYDLGRNLKTATAAETYLTQELEVLSAGQVQDFDKIKQKHVQEMETLKIDCSVSHQVITNLEQDLNDVRTENAKLKDMIASQEEVLKDNSNITSVGSKEYADKCQNLETENLVLLEKLDHVTEKMNKFLRLIAEKESQIEVLKEQILCVKENLASKRDELEEKSQLLESSQERICEIQQELSALKSCPENINRKGNSLFAEVDDQRQQLRAVLAAQKKQFLEMKKKYFESEYEIRQLKRENAAMHSELEICSSLFLNADKVYKQKLNERILQLVRQTEVLEQKLSWTQEKLISIAEKNGINWLDSMLNFCKGETDQLKKQLHSTRIQKSLLEESLLVTQQQLAKWRFEALKSRCVIISRETLLEEKGIKFKDKSSLCIEIDERDCEIAKPEIARPTKDIFKSQTTSASQECNTETLLMCNVVENSLHNFVDEQENTSQLLRLAANVNQFELEPSEEAAETQQNSKIASHVELGDATEFEECTNSSLQKVNFRPTQFEIYQDQTADLKRIHERSQLNEMSGHSGCNESAAKMSSNVDNFNANQGGKPVLQSLKQWNGTDERSSEALSASKKTDPFEILEDDTDINTFDQISDVFDLQPLHAEEKFAIYEDTSTKSIPIVRFQNMTVTKQKENCAELANLQKIKELYTAFTPHYREITLTPQRLASLSSDLHHIDSIKKKKPIPLNLEDDDLPASLITATTHLSMDNVGKTDQLDKMQTQKQRSRKVTVKRIVIKPKK